MSYLTEFEDIFEIPSVIRDAEGIEDMSWHNDTCPSFGRELRDGSVIKIFCEHPDPEQRDSGSDGQFIVYYDGDVDEPVWEGDDPNEALIQMLMVISAPR